MGIIKALNITETNQLIISFQTDENSVNSGYIGDLYSIMKIIISKPGIPLEEIKPLKNRNN